MALLLATETAVSSTPSDIISFKAGSEVASIREDLGAVTLTVERRNVSSDFIEVGYYTSGTGQANSATPGLDFQDVQQTEGAVIDFTDAQTEATIVIDIFWDDVSEEDEEFFVTLYEVSAEATLADPIRSTVTITNVPKATSPGVVEFTGTNYSVDEDASPAVIEVRRRDATGQTASVNFATSDTATGIAPNHYTQTNTTLTWAEGENSVKQVNVPVVNVLPDVTITWIDNSTTESGFEIQRSLDGAAWTTIGTVGPNITTFTDSDVDLSKTRQYRVRSFNSFGESVWATSTTFGPTDATTQDKEVALTLSNVVNATLGTSSATLTIKDKSVPDTVVTGNVSPKFGVKLEYPRIGAYWIGGTRNYEDVRNLVAAQDFIVTNQTGFPWGPKAPDAVNAWDGSTVTNTPTYQNWAELLTDLKTTYKYPSRPEEGPDGTPGGGAQQLRDPNSATMKIVTYGSFMKVSESFARDAFRLEKCRTETGPAGSTNAPDWLCHDSTGAEVGVASGGGIEAGIQVNVSTYVTPDSEGLYFPDWDVLYNYLVYWHETGLNDGAFMDNVRDVPWNCADWDGDGTDDCNLLGQNAWSEGLVRWYNKFAAETGEPVMGNATRWFRTDSPGGGLDPRIDGLYDTGLSELLAGKRNAPEGSYYTEDQTAQTLTLQTNGFGSPAEMFARYEAAYPKGQSEQDWLIMMYGPPIEWLSWPGQQDEFRHLRYMIGLVYVSTEAMLAYCHYNKPTAGPNRAGWPDEYDLAGTTHTSWMGLATEAAVRWGSPKQTVDGVSDVYWREFENALVVYRARDPSVGTGEVSSVNVTLPSPGTGRQWVRINGVQDPTTNNGATQSTTLSMRHRDGLVLRRV